VETAPTFIPDEKIREIREASSIVELISEYVRLKKTGVNYKGLCPFHQEKTPSFVVNENKKIFHCFGCHASGDIFTFLMKHENMGFQEAARLLAKRYGIQLPEKPLSPQQKKHFSEREALFGINERVAAFYHNLLLHDERCKKARDYLEKRGISKDTIQHYRLGCAPNSWDTAVGYLRSEKASLLQASKLGLIVSKGQGRYYDRFRNRIIFPICNVSHHVVGFGGRIIDAGEPKYLNSPESVIYNKRHNLYGIDTAAQHIQKEDRAVVVEGYFDLLTLHQNGIKSAVAPLGTALTEQQIKILKRYTQNIITIFDADASGEKAMIRSLEPFLHTDISPRLVLLPEGEDPDSYMRKNGMQVFLDHISKSGLLLDFVIEKIIQKHDIVSPRGKRNACDEIVPLLKEVSDTLERNLYIQKIAQRLNIKDTDILSRLERVQQQKNGPEISGQKRARDRESPSGSQGNAEYLLLKLIISFPDEVVSIIDNGAFLEELTDTNLKELGLLLCRVYNEQGTLDPAHLMGLIENGQWKQVLAESSCDDIQTTDPVKLLENYIRAMRLKRNSQQQREVNNLLKQAEAQHEEALTRKYIRQNQDLLQEKRRIIQFKIDS